ncbi:MAG: hypothetical protein E3J64_02430 [Anaerolineales bacterium]|nr:MAG: hypothetical protein E3J64_02430 [Anaerolineales bacterium]
MPNGGNGNLETVVYDPRKRIGSHMTASKWLHVADALEIGKLRIFAGNYARGSGASVMTVHHVDLDDARVLFQDLAIGRDPAYKEFKGSPMGEGAESRVLEVRKDSKEEKIWVSVKKGPGTVTENGAVQPAGEPEVVLNIPFTMHQARKLGSKVLSYIRAWESQHLLAVTPISPVRLHYGDGSSELTQNLFEIQAFRTFVDGHEGVLPGSQAELATWAASEMAQAAAESAAAAG